MTTIPYSHNGEIIQLVPLEEYEKLQHELTTAQADAVYWQQRAAAMGEVFKEMNTALDLKGFSEHVHPRSLLQPFL